MSDDDITTIFSERGQLPLSSASLDHLPPEKAARILKEVSQAGILVAGNVGTGKTFLLHALAKRFGDLAMMANASRWINDFRADALGLEPPHFKHGRVTYNPAHYQAPPDVIQRAFAARYVMIDDLGVHKPTSFAEEQLYLLIDERISKRKSLAVVTNEMPDAIERINPRIFDRLRTLHPVFLIGESRRGGE